MVVMWRKAVLNNRLNTSIFKYWNVYSNTLILAYLSYVCVRIFILNIACGLMNASQTNFYHLCPNQFLSSLPKPISIISAQTNFYHLCPNQFLSSLPKLISIISAQTNFYHLCPNQFLPSLLKPISIISAQINNWWLLICNISFLPEKCIKIKTQKLQILEY